MGRVHLALRHGPDTAQWQANGLGWAAGRQPRARHFRPRCCMEAALVLIAAVTVTCCTRGVCSADGPRDIGRLHALLGRIGPALGIPRQTPLLRQVLRGGSPNSGPYASPRSGYGQGVSSAHPPGSSVRTSGIKPLGTPPPGSSVRPSGIKPLGNPTPQKSSKKVQSAAHERQGSPAINTGSAGWEGRMVGDTRKGGIVGRHLAGRGDVSPTKIERLVGRVRFVVALACVHS